MRHWESLGSLAGGLAHDFNNLLTRFSVTPLSRRTPCRRPRGAAHAGNIVAAGESSADLVLMLLATSGYRPRYNQRLELDRLLDWMLENRPLPPNVRVSREVESALFSGERRSLDTCSGV